MARGPSRVPSESLRAGFLVATGIALLEFCLRSRGVQLPATEQLAYLGIVTLLTWAVGLVGGALYLLPFLQRLRAAPAGPVIVSAFAFFYAFAEILAIIEMQHRTLAARSLLAISLALTLFFCLRWLTNWLPLLRNARLWSYANVVALLAVLLLILLRAPHGQRSGIAGLVLALFVLLVLTLTHAALLEGRWLAMLPLGGGVLLLLPVAIWELAPTTDSRPSPNVILISVDTLRADHLGCYSPRVASTPNIDLLAAEGVTFEQAITPVPLTNPSHTTMLTGLYPGNHGVVVNRPLALASKADALPLILRDAGYRTAAFVGGFPLLKNASRMASLFEVYDDSFGPASTVMNLARTHTLPRFFVKTFLPGGIDSFARSDLERPGSGVLAAAGDWLRHNADNPFFLFVHLYDPHGAYWPPQEYRQVESGSAAERARGDWYGLGPEEREEILADPLAVEAFSRLYRGEVDHVDHLIGVLLGVLREERLLDKSLIVFTADHGENLTEHDYYFDHAVSLFDESLHVPLIFRPPDGIRWRGRRGGRVTLIDIAPTILDFLDLPVPEADGESLLPLLEGDRVTKERVVLSAVFPESRLRNKSLLAVLEGQFKYVRTLPWWHDLQRMPGSEELYDLSADPDETSNVLDAQPEVAQRLAGVASVYVDLWLAGDRVPSSELPPEVKKRLKTLGYL